ncbi:MAG: hypothetical protein NTX61_18535 [Bacteroidetes bacterium]|nr:hypothetical protein [Bacteroidota bacterium]
MKACLHKINYLLVGLILLYSSCNKTNPEPSPTDSRAKFLGTWTVTETKKKQTYQVDISTGSGSSSQIAISNFANYLAIATASVSGNTITLNSNQQLFNGSSYITLISGVGSYSSSTNTIVMSYIYNDQANQYTINAIFSK